ncbi:MAG TPA: polysaccharide deacetylase family protein [Fimbriimonadaceae bacterium]|nr:polysaccharide deacetylase family protein [Fimbriimonadaceae bacterium]
MTGLAISLALQLAAKSPSPLPFHIPFVRPPGVNLRQELRAIQWPRNEKLKVIADAYQPKTIALTFDDGPHGAKTMELLALLRKLDVKATFFVVGKMVVRNPWIVREEIAQGHEVGNHTFNHPNLDLLSEAQIAREYRACSDAIQWATGIRPKFCRPPGGRFDTDVLRAATDEGMWTVLWTDDPGDFAKPNPKVLIERIDTQMRNGGILLLHDGIPQTLQVLPGLVEGLRKRGYRFVTCSQLLDQRNRRPTIYAKHAPATKPGPLMRRKA